MQKNDDTERIKLDSDGDELEGRITNADAENGCFIRQEDEMMQKGSIRELDPKDHSALNLTKLCLLIVVGVWFIDEIIAIIKPDVTHALTEQVFDMLKYVVTACLGFFFGASTKNNK